MTKDEAIKLYETGFWEQMSYRDRAMFQMFESKLCMPFSVFHEAMEKSLERPVFTHEFGLDSEGLRKELLGDRPTPTFEEILNLIPEEKRIVIASDGQSDAKTASDAPNK